MHIVTLGKYLQITTDLRTVTRVKRKRIGGAQGDEEAGIEVTQGESEPKMVLFQFGGIAQRDQIYETVSGQWKKVTGCSISSDEEMLESNYHPSVGDGSPRTSLLSNTLKNLEGSPFQQANEEELD